MMKKSGRSRFRIIGWTLALLFPLAGNAQNTVEVTVKQRLTAYDNRTLQEKLFLHLDRPLYLVGETIWLKAYYVDGHEHRALDVSKVAYIEVLDQELNPVIQTKISLANGKGEGSIQIPTSLTNGTYTVRGYTNWMKNFSPDFYFETAIIVLNPFEQSTSTSVVSPLQPSYDVQFFPEGGNLIEGLPSRIAFRAIDQTGKGIDFDGAIINQENDTLIRFQPLRFGIGRFSFTPTVGQMYRAVIRDKKGASFTYPLPDIRTHGYVMQVQDSNDQLIQVKVAIRLPSDQITDVFLLAHTRLGIVHSEGKITSNGEAAFTLNKSALGEGITHFTVFNQASQPVCERLYFKRPTRRFTISETLSQPSYATRSKVQLDLTTSTTSELKNLSVSVYLEDSLAHPDPVGIHSYLWLTSELKGTIESPSYYLEANSPEVIEALDNLMLTHGFSHYTWADVQATAPTTYKHLPEYGGHLIFGKVRSVVTGKPTSSVSTYLASPDQYPKLFSAISDSLGNLRFEVKKLYDTREIIVQANPRGDTTNRVELLSPYSDKYSSRRWIEVAQSQQNTEQLLTRSINMQTFNAFIARASVRSTPLGVDSLGFFGRPTNKYFLDAYTRFPTMEEVMREYVPGVFVRKRQGKFHFYLIDQVNPTANTFTDDPMILLDGIPVFNTDKIIAFDPLKVKKLEVVNSLYYLGNVSFSGIVSYTTYKGDLGDFELNPRALVQSYQFMQSKKEFYAPRYDSVNSKQGRLPDFRNLLHWAPSLTTDTQGKQSLNFYTSDQTGTYRVVVQGITPSGLTGSREFTFKVMPQVSQ